MLTQNFKSKYSDHLCNVYICGLGCEINFDAELALRRGDSVYLVGLTKSLQLKSRKSIVTNTCSVLNIQSSVFPRYRAMNAEFIELETGTGE